MSTRAYLVGAACLLCVTWMLFFATPEGSRFGSDREAFWMAEIQKSGGVEAYKTFARVVRAYTEPDKHLEAHAFGAALYLTEGVSALSVCDERYGYGCFHQFMGHAISDLGLTSITSLSEACFAVLQSNRAWCQHAIGHGLIAALGYEEKNLTEALSLCRGLPYDDPARGCYGGVFMEYNIRTMLGSDTPVREYTGNLIDVCEIAETASKPTCFYWLPQWWHESHLLEKEDTEAFATMGSYCDTHAPSQTLLESCYRGIGLITPQTALYEPRYTQALCRAASTDDARFLACLSNAVGIISGVANREDAETACEGLGDISYEYCMAYATNEASQIHPRALPMPL